MRIPVVATWTMSFDQLQGALARRCSAAPDPGLLLARDRSPPTCSTRTRRCGPCSPFDSTLSEVLMIGRIIRDISRFALVKVDPGSNSLQIHRLVQAVIQAQMTDEERIDARHELHKILTGARPRAGRDRRPGELEHLRDHLAAPRPVAGGGVRRPANQAAADRLGALPVEGRRVRGLPEPGEPARGGLVGPARRG